MLVSPERTIRELHSKGLWGDTTLSDLFFRNVAQHDDRTALVDAHNRASLVDGPAKRLSYRELGAQTNALSHQLVSLGLEKDDIVLVQMPNIAELVLTYLAALQIGVVISPVAMQFREHELAHITRRLRPRAFVTCSQFKGFDHVGLAEACCDELDYDILVWGDEVAEPHFALSRATDGVGLQGTGADASLADSAQRTLVSADDVATICWTSGTEGVPKGVPRSHNHWISIGHATYDAAAIGPGEALLNPFPLINMASIGGLFMSWLQSGGRLVLHHPLDLAVFLRQIEEEEIQHTVVPPALLNMILLDDKLKALANFESVRTISSGSAPLPPAMTRAYSDDFGVEIVNLFGSNEGVALASGPGDVSDPELRAAVFPRFGRSELTWKNRVSSHVETQLRDLETDEEILEPGHTGEMLVRGATVFDGYFGPDGLDRKDFTEDGFFRTGDLFQIAGDGDAFAFYRFVGRCKQLIIRGGMNISPEDVEAVLSGHPQLAEVAVVGYPDPTMGEKVCAVVVPRPEQRVTLEAITDYLKQRDVAVYKLPERVRVVEALPRNPMNKVRRDELRRLAATPADETNSQ
ncbi:MAG: class I adenylate-forming enzyme family protein [Myxococcota bacterium]|jgi:acyl-CoA synthetase (AMP-forming)/AMP-acid ligase II|nr:class I adenylate-forming enzyme family protein [Myxococcota bacterium]